MPDWTDEEEKAAQEQWHQLMARIQAAYGRRDTDPYALGTEVRAVLDDRDLYLKVGYESARQLLTEIPNCDLAVLFHDASVVQVCSRAESDKYGWPKMELFAALLEGGVMERLPGELGDAIVKVHVGTKRVPKRFADCTQEELKALADEIEKSRPKKKSDPHRQPDPPPPPAATQAGLTTAGKTLAAGVALGITAWAARWAWPPVQYASIAGGAIVVAVIMKLGWAASWQLLRGLFAWAKGPGRVISGGFLALAVALRIIGVFQPAHPPDRSGREVVRESEPSQPANRWSPPQIDSPPRGVPRQEIGAATDTAAARASPPRPTPVTQPSPSGVIAPGSRPAGEPPPEPSQAASSLKPAPVDPQSLRAARESSSTHSQATEAVPKPSLIKPSTHTEPSSSATANEVVDPNVSPTGSRVRRGQLLQVGGQDDTKDLKPEELKAQQRKDARKPAKCCQD